MPTAVIPRSALSATRRRESEPEIQRLAAVLRNAFGVSFSFWDNETGELAYPSTQQPGSNDPTRGDLIRGVIGLEPLFLQDEDPLLLLAVPFNLTSGYQITATAAFALRRPEASESCAGAARVLSLEPEAARSWLARQECWTADALLRLAATTQMLAQTAERNHRLQDEVEKLSDNLASTYEEVCLLHGVTQNLRISHDEEQLSRLVVGWLLDCIPVESVAVLLLPVARQEDVTYRCRTSRVLIGAGPQPLTDEQLLKLVADLNIEPGCGPMVINGAVTALEGWSFPQVRQVILAPLCAGGKPFGWLAAFNHAQNSDFSSIEASLLNSVAAMLAIHAGNRDLYRQQSEFLASVVKTLSSAIDAKDPYTCGHSDRVARVAVRLAKELGCSPETLHTLYMAGLLHDIGKIGISDQVLCKPGRLTPEEFEQIKEHPGLGYRILAELNPLSDVLPAVLHHHEQWDGKGYPMQLAGDQIPEIARIMAVADAFDAMSSDRPYRKGLPVAEVDRIFREGSGKQWDARVVSAFFAAREDITDIARRERANLTLDVRQWL